MDFIKDNGLTTQECDPYYAEERTCSWERKENCTYYRCNELRYMTNAYDIKLAILSIGPVTSQMLVYEDLVNYKEGIYQHTGGQLLFIHVVTIVGWGVDESSGLEYWIVGSSWGSDWGDGGYFKIKFDEVGIGYLAVTCFVESM